MTTGNEAKTPHGSKCIEKITDIRLVHMLLLDLLSEFDKICASLNIPYSLAGGTLLGAVRRGDFLPWDDDADVFLLRDDYEIFVAHCKEVGFEKPWIEMQVDAHGPWVRLRDTRIQAKHPTNAVFKHLFIDVFPLDGIPENQQGERTLQQLSFVRRVRLGLSSRVLSGKHRARRALSCVSPFMRAAGALRATNALIDRMAKRGNKDEPSYVGELVAQAKVKGVVRKDCFGQSVCMKLGGRAFKVMPDYDSYLHSCFGDYFLVPRNPKSHSFSISAPSNLVEALRHRQDVQGEQASQAIVQYLVDNGIVHFFGYQGTMIARFVDAVEKNPLACNHVCRNESAAAFGASAYAKLTGTPAVAYATSGPGVVNMLSGISDAYMDSAPLIVVAGQLNEKENHSHTGVRQQGFQHVNIASMAASVCKSAFHVQNAHEVPAAIHEAVAVACGGRPGPVLVDLPMDIQGQNVAEFSAQAATTNLTGNEGLAAEAIASLLREARRPVLLLGNGLAKTDEARARVRCMIDALGVPFATSMIARDTAPADHALNLGFVGAAYGHRSANIALAQKADLVVSLGCSMCPRQTGQNTEAFAQEAAIVRVDIDPRELARKVHGDEVGFLADANVVASLLRQQDCGTHKDWANQCGELKKLCDAFESQQSERLPNSYMQCLGIHAKGAAVFCCDVGQHQVWAASSLTVGEDQRMLFSGGHGAMGFALPAAIAACHANRGRVWCIVGDGGMQMSLQELQTIAHEQLPVTVVVMDNHSLGLITQQQDDFFDGFHAGASSEFGYSAPDFVAVSEAFGIDASRVSTVDQFASVLDKTDPSLPHIVVVDLPESTKALPKTYFGESMVNQRPYLDKATRRAIEAL